MIDITFDVYSDTPIGKDPDSSSKTLREYHKILWSKELPNGISFELDTNTKQLLHHKSSLGEFYLSTDSICNTYSKAKNMQDIVKNISPDEINKFYKLCSTVGAYIIYPSKKIQNKMTFNIARGINSKIKDRFDLSLECIKRHYENNQSPLSETILRYKEFFNLYGSFKEYVDFYLLQDLVDDKYCSINFFLPFDDFNRKPLPLNLEEYTTFKSNVTKFVNKRNERILMYSNTIK